MKSSVRVVALVAAFLLVAGMSFATGGGEEAADKPIVFGGALPLTGWGADAGVYNNQGYLLWEKHVNEDGGILGRPVKLVSKGGLREMSG